MPLTSICQVLFSLVFDEPVVSYFIPFFPYLFLIWSERTEIEVRRCWPSSLLLSCFRWNFLLAFLFLTSGRGFVIFKCFIFTRSGPPGGPWGKGLC